MKNIIALIIFLSISIVSFGQYDAFNFQSLVLDANLNPIANSKVIVSTSISADNLSSNVYYQEEIELTTSPDRTIAYPIGSGVPISGAFSDINWTSSIPYI